MRRASIGVWLCLLPSLARAQAPAAPAAPGDEPSIRVGTTIYTDYSFTVEPQATDANGQLYSPNAFNLTRGYLNVTGQLSRLVAFRLTPDVARETGAGSSLSGSLEFRVKYAFLQLNLDRWTGTGSWARLGVQQTPWLDFAENIYRYRFQGTMFAEREGYFASADTGASFHYNLPSGLGDVHAGVYNGENFNKAEVNDQKALMVRGTVRPFAKGPAALRGLRGSVFVDADHYVAEAERRRLIGGLTYEHRLGNAGFEYLATSDRVRAVAFPTDGRGYSVWVTPKLRARFEGLLRVDHLKPDTRVAAVRRRTIAGVAYWFPTRNGVSSALLVDYDGQTFAHHVVQPPAQRKIAVHALVQY
jgi:hypothetical protein